MNPRTWTLIGATVVVLGLGVLALGLVEQESTVRQVGQVVTAPEGYTAGTWTLVGVPQPATVPVFAEGAVGKAPNPAFADAPNATKRVVLWEQEGRPMQSVHRVEMEARDGATHWRHTNTTRTAGGEDPVSIANATWTITGAHTAFPIEGFQKGDVDEAWVWAVYDGTLRDPLQPKPSQFTGRLMTHLPDGTPLPDGVLLFDVETYTAGCSSKFLPDDHEDVEA